MVLQFLLICRVLLMQCRGIEHFISCRKQVSVTVFSVFSSFLTDRFYRNLGNTCTSDWACTTTGVLQGFLLSLCIFLIFTTDMTLEAPKQTPKMPTESRYVNDFEFWRIGTDFYHLLIQTQIAIINLQTWCLK